MPLYFLGALVIANDVSAQTLTAGVVMEKMEAGDRYTYVAGIVEGLAHARFVKDNKDTQGRACIYTWFYDDKATLPKIYAAFEKYPGTLPGAVVGALAATKCGV
ncbi:hypothetical protein [Bosea sp. 124]|uniref:hypothetical protein n=1 Tax=Bosea sp. 124 TaxID=2135642 RepID=UPI0011B2829D|nr:hypothetical protein [Bosea sp. 124]